jgi:hypothetical protein
VQAAEVAGAWEGVAVADLDQDAGSGRNTDSGVDFKRLRHLRC